MFKAQIGSYQPEGLNLYMKKKIMNYCFKIGIKKDSISFVQDKNKWHTICTMTMSQRFQILSTSHTTFATLSCFLFAFFHLQEIGEMCAWWITGLLIVFKFFIVKVGWYFSRTKMWQVLWEELWHCILNII